MKSTVWINSYKRASLTSNMPVKKVAEPRNQITVILFCIKHIKSLFFLTPHQNTQIFENFLSKTKSYRPFKILLNLKFTTTAKQRQFLKFTAQPKQVQINHNFATLKHDHEPNQQIL